jgi:hypothetical protein
MATNAEWDPQRTLLVAAVSIRPSSSSTTMDIDAAIKDSPSALSSTKSRTHAASVNRASSSASTSHHATSSTLSYPVASSR